jgi:hypothetical protein
MPFILQKETAVPELDSLLRLYRHEPTGARLLSVINKDENKVFGITFRTPPRRSDGVAHILEHSVLCGSRKYPVKEPFVELMKGSLNTFLNAMTYPDKTCYPVASTNLKDFYNLVDVYLDAVFYPNLTEYTFLQEGWHYEVDPQTKEFSYKGVVFNEMKGAYSDPEDMHDDLCRRSLYPDTSYGLDSGGDPLEIPTLSYQEFLDFHKKYYHPSNSFIFFYGDDEPERRLALLEEWLAPFGLASIDSLPQTQMRFDEPRYIEYMYQAGEQDQPKAYAAVNWALRSHGDVLHAMQASILFHILTGTSASPLRKALIESGLGEGLAGFGYSEELLQTAFSVGLKGVEPTNVREVEKLIFSTLEALAREGIEKDAIEASLNAIEFALREKNTGRYPRGLAVMLEALNEWLYNQDPIEALAFAGPLEKTKKAYADNPRLFSELIDELLLGNTHRTTVVLLPSPDANKEREEAEKAMLDKARMAFSDAELAQIMRATDELRRLQDTPDSPEALATIPVLSLEDIPKEAPVLPSELLLLTETPQEGGTLAQGKQSAMDARRSETASSAFYHELATGSIVYLDLGFSFAKLESRLLPYVSLLGRLLLETGTDKESYVQLIQRIGINTGGIRSTSVSASRWDSREPSPWFFLRAKALPEKAESLADILIDILTGARFDNPERLRQIVLEEKAQAEAMLVPAATRMVSLRLRSRFNPADWASERLYGIEHLFFLRSLAQKIESDWPSVLADIEDVRRAILVRDNLIVNVTTDRVTLNSCIPSISRIVDALPRERARSARNSWIHEAISACDSGSASRPAAETLELPAQVNSVGMIVPLWNAGDRSKRADEAKGFTLRARKPDSIEVPAGAWLVVTKFLDTAYLWEQVRVIGGAYGGYSNLDLASGLLLLLSYRDPNIERTLDVYRNVAAFLKTCSVPPEEIQKSIIGTIGDIDAYQLPDAKGFNALMNTLTGYTQEARQQIRDSILAVSLDDFRHLGALIEEALGTSMTGVLGAPDRIKLALPAFPAPVERLSMY